MPASPAILSVSNQLTACRGPAACPGSAATFTSSLADHFPFPPLLWCTAVLEMEESGALPATSLLRLLCVYLDGVPPSLNPRPLQLQGGWFGGEFVLVSPGSGRSRCCA